MATRLGRRRPPARLRCEPLEPRETPAAVRVINFEAGFVPGRMIDVPFGIVDGDLLLTNGPHQARAVWAPARVHVGAFQTSFVFRLEGEPGRLGDGFTFALAGTRPVRAGAAGGGLGYAGLTDSVAVKFDLVDNAGEGGQSVGVFTGGAEPTMPAVRLDGSPVHLHSQHPIRADLAYDGTVLTVALTDTTAPDQTWTHAFPVDIPGALGAGTGFAGFTAGTGELSANHVMESWTFAEVVPAVPDGRPPEITTPPRVSSTGNPDFLYLTAGATDDGGPGGLTYTWQTVSAPPGAAAMITATANDPTTASAVLSELGTYTFRVTVRDADGQTATAEVSYTAQPRLFGLKITPRPATVPAGGSVQLTAVGYDIAEQPIPGPVSARWRVANGPGTVDANGLYTAPATGGGPVTIQAEALVLSPGNFWYVTDEVTVQVEDTPPDNQPPEITGPIHVSLIAGYLVLGAPVTDDGGTAGLRYDWEAVSAPPGEPPHVVQNGRPDAWVMLTEYGTYTFRLTVRDAEGQTATREVSYTKVPRAVRFEITPRDARVPVGGTVQFRAIGYDERGNRMPNPIEAAWWVMQGPGRMDYNGLYTAPPDLSGAVTIHAEIGLSDGIHAPFRVTDEVVVVIDPAIAWGGEVDLTGGFAGADLARNGSARVVGDRLRLADGPFQAGSAFIPEPVEVRGFATTFEFQVGDAPEGRLGDGLTFVIQGAGPDALGAAGEGLGYAGIGRSVAVKFDLVDNAGEGTDSVGVFTGGAAPTTPADHPVASDGRSIQLHSGHVFQGRVTYAGGVLRVGLSDTVDRTWFSQSYAVDLPAAVGGTTARIGFTAGTGELFAPIDVLNWTYTPTDNWFKLYQTVSFRV